MTDAQIFSWILLSLDERGSTRREIAETADAINHAVPTHQELETSLQWLQERGFVQKDQIRFAVTSAGSAFVNRFRSPDQPILQTWHKVADAIEHLM